MGEKTGIEWTDATWNPWRGCTKVSPGCKNCYMYREQTRHGREPSVVIRAAEATFNAPLKWKESKRVFTCSWSDWFHEDADGWREEAWEIVRKTPHLTYQILTKRPLEVEYRLPKDWGNGYPNVWLGVSVESDEFMYRVKLLRQIPAALRFISFEPLLGSADVFMRLNEIDWVITGGESGPGARPADPDWFRSIRDECRRNGIPYFHKQNGGTSKVNGNWGGHFLDGTIYHQFPSQYRGEK